MVDVNDRKNWVRLSMAMASIRDTMAMVEVQFLCRLNFQLTCLEARLMSPEDFDANPDMSQAERLAEVGGQSWLWVLGAYEVFRRAKTRIGSHPAFTLLSNEISEIRMVLAKQEARSAKPDTWQRPKHLLTAGTHSYGWGYWNRHGDECKFIRADFAKCWLEFGEAYVVPE
jgi:hypothetical protein